MAESLLPKAYGLELVGGELELTACGLWHRAYSLELIVYGFELIVYGLDLKETAKQDWPLFTIFG